MAVSDRDDDELPGLFDNSDSEEDTSYMVNATPKEIAEAPRQPIFAARAKAKAKSKIRPRSPLRSEEDEVDLKITRFFNDMSAHELYVRHVNGVTLFEHLLRDVKNNRRDDAPPSERIMMGRAYYQRLKMLFGPEDNLEAPNQVPVVDLVAGRVYQL